MVAGFLQGAELAQLPGTHLAAATGIQDMAGASGALQRLGGTLAGVCAGLRFHLEGKQAMERVSLLQASWAESLKPRTGLSRPLTAPWPDPAAAIQGEGPRHWEKLQGGREGGDTGDRGQKNTSVRLC